MTTSYHNSMKESQGSSPCGKNCKKKGSAIIGKQTISIWTDIHVFVSLYRSLFVWINCTSLKHFTYEDIVGTWYIIPLTLFLGFSRFIRSKPIPVRTYFMEPSKLSRTAGCLKKKIKDKCIYILYLQVFYLSSYFCWSFSTTT